MNYPSYDPKATSVELEVRAARAAAHAKHGANSIEAQASDSPHWLPILIEEVGEVASALTYDKNPDSLRAELIDVLAVAAAWLDSIDSDSENGQ
jgi:NTP pyrophosphatase (non-canonical NTP hydrolase)